MIQKLVEEVLLPGLSLQDQTQAVQVEHIHQPPVLVVMQHQKGLVLPGVLREKDSGLLVDAELPDAGQQPQGKLVEKPAEKPAVETQQGAPHRIQARQPPQATEVRPLTMKVV
mmetsp:Transcript_33712/g.51703  ORF Transcript_33712/g.51703 Transcript_33712/m.51703 type:complete len:113 (-) Transcript_33712:176-514(-)